MNLLVQNYNPSTIDGLMCRSQLSIGYDGRIFDCDFHQMENIYINSNDHKPMTIFELESLEQVKSTIPGGHTAMLALRETELVVVARSLNQLRSS